MWATENSQSIFNKKPQEECIDKQKLCYIASKVAIWDHFCIPQDQHLALDKNEKLKTLHEYYKKLVPVYFGDGKNGSYFFCRNSGFFSVWDLDYYGVLCLNFKCSGSMITNPKGLFFLVFTDSS